jgi:tetratricopeptide (TPR) repeat protein
LSIAQRALEAAPGSADTNYLVGRLQLQQAETREEIDSGLANLEKALNIDAQHQPSLMFLAQIYLQLENPERAMAFANRAVSAYPGDPDVYEARALLLLARESYDRALSDLNRAKQLNQDMVASPYIRAGETYYAMQRYEDGRREFERAVQIHPANLLARLGVAHYFTLTGQPVAALLEYNKINNDLPGRPIVLALTGRSYMGMSRPDKALDNFIAAIDRSRKLNQLPAAEFYTSAAEAALSTKVDNPVMAVNLYLGLLVNFWGQDSAYDGHLGIAKVLETVAEYRAIARGHLAWALALRANDKNAAAMLRGLDDAYLSLVAIKDMVNKMGYPPALAALIVRETPLDFVVEASQESMNELQKVLPGEVALAIFQSQEKHQDLQRAGSNKGLNTAVTGTDAAALQGTWSATLQDETGNYAGEFHLQMDGTGRYRFDLWQGNERSSEQGTYQILRTTLQFRSDNGETSEYQFELRGNQLFLAEGTDDGIILTKSP